jgi:hypothetical protein
MGKERLIYKSFYLSGTNTLAYFAGESITAKKKKSFMTSAKGCRKCNGCLNGPVRGNYDGLVVLCAVTKETLPNVGTTVSAASNVNRCLLTEQLTVC